MLRNELARSIGRPSEDPVDEISVFESIGLEIQRESLAAGFAEAVLIKSSLAGNSRLNVDASQLVVL